jgi:two-component system chemotaxis response regulator CheB
MSSDGPPDYCLIVIGASAGGVEALIDLARGLPRDIRAAICVVVHFPVDASSHLPQILNQAGRLPAQHAQDGQPLAPGRLYVAPPNCHLLVSSGKLHLVNGPRTNGVRPAIDPLFRSAAEAYGARTIGVLLSGALDDGVDGLRVIKEQGGLALVQDPDEALFDSLPRTALANVDVDMVLPQAGLGPALARLAAQRAAMPLAETGQTRMAQDRQDQFDGEMVARDKAALERGERPGEPTLFTCPDCGGVLWELRNGGTLHFRCHTGHAYTAEALRVGQAQALDEALWVALRSLEESAALSRRLANRATTASSLRTAQHFEERAANYERQAAMVRNLITAPVAGNGSEGAEPVAADQSDVAG